MEPRGHYGTTLLFGAFFVLGLDLVSGLVATAIMLGFARVPDKDQLFKDNVIRHRKQFHTPLFAIAVAVVTASTVAYLLQVGQRLAIDYGLLAAELASTIEVWWFLAVVVSASILVHIVTDALTKGGGYKVYPLWPVSSWSVSLDRCKSDDEVWNAALFASGGTAFGAAVLHELYYSFLPAVL